MVASTAFLSDNTAGAHPAVLDAVVAASAGSAEPYAEDARTAEATDALRTAFDSPDAEVVYALTGTGANVAALAAAVRPWEEILCSDVAHVIVDEAGGVVRISGATLTALPSRDGILDPEQLDRAITTRGIVHHCQPRIVTITQCTEKGRVWDPGAIAEFIDHAHALDLLVHVDGARIANAIAALDVAPLAAAGDADIITVGGTKNGLLLGDALLVRRPVHFDGIRFVHKQIGHLASKNRFVSAQFNALLRDGLWLQLAGHANAMASRLSAGLVAAGVELAVPTDANEVFVNLAAETYAALSRYYMLEQPDPMSSVVRFVCSWSTTVDEVDAILATAAAL
ncbi:threonine aldolase [Mycolicibacterium sp. CH28]|uniref:threonine aldolase family protein n=1 Tax=Mycolicibacterium sp. CH28 TaxID=2512237 RepID=UPI00108086CF|nr:beta-eliminating lyase-related protein [Mycolicibacterium sp. CH28]TGD84275.1 threonine aldolase [Mycolicibacterium sp. CH28]